MPPSSGRRYLTAINVLHNTRITKLVCDRASYAVHRFPGRIVTPVTNYSRGDARWSVTGATICRYEVRIAGYGGPDSVVRLLALGLEQTRCDGYGRWPVFRQRHYSQWQSWLRP